ncbi:unnamed protein product, partial [Ixodes persulcatus]
LWEHQPSWVCVFFGQLVVVFVSVFGGFFFVLLRMVGAFGGRKVQNITHWYTFALRFYSVFMIILTAVNGIFIACLWGSSGHLAIANTKSAAILEPGVPMVRDYVTTAIAVTPSFLHGMLISLLTWLNSANSGAARSRRAARSPVLNYTKLAARAGPPHASFDIARPPLSSKIKSISPLYPPLSSHNPQPPRASRSDNMLVRERLDGCEEEHTRWSDVEACAAHRKANNNFFVSALDLLVDLVIFGKFVNETVYPNVTFMSVLGQLSIYGDIFKQGYGYTTTVCASATVLQVLMALSFVLGIFYHDEEVPPNKRGFITNQSGIIMVVTCLFMWVFCAAMMLAAALFMTGGVLGYNYLCLPFYDNRLQFVDKIIGALFVPGGVNKDADPRIVEFYDTTLKPSLVLRNSCDNNMSLIKLSHMRDIKDFEKQFLVANPPKYISRLRSNSGLSAAGLSTNQTWSTSAFGQILTTLEDNVKGLKDRSPFFTCTLQLVTLFLLIIVFFQHLLSYLMPIVGKRLATMDSVRDYVYESLGNCKPLFTFYKNAFNAFCESNIVHLNGFWLALWLVCFLFSCIVTVALKLSKYLMRMDDYLYAGIEVEESV